MSITNACYRTLLTPVGALANVAMATTIVWITFGEHPFIVATGLAFAPLALGTTFPFAAALRRRSHAARRAGATTTTSIEEGITNILAVQSLGGEGRERRRFGRDSRESFGRFRRVVVVAMAAFFVSLVPSLALGAGPPRRRVEDQILLPSKSLGPSAPGSIHPAQRPVRSPEPLTPGGMGGRRPFQESDPSHQDV